MKTVLTSFDGNTVNFFLKFLMYLQINSTEIYGNYAKLWSTFDF